MKISIITVVYNNERTIADAIESVLSQSYKNIEYIIVDGDSNDKTKEIITRYSGQIDKYVSEKDLGIYDAMNKGIKMSTGDIIGILNSDDLYEDAEVIADVVKKFKKNEELGILYGDLVYVSAKDTNKVIRKWKSKSYDSSFFERGNIPPHPTLFLRSSIYNNVGFFNIKYKLAADYDFMLRAFKKFGNASEYFPRLMVKMRLGGATNKSLQNIINGNKEILLSWKSNGLKPPFMLMPFRVFKRLIQFI
jgi:glycosyltransferase involved in cell wall biosynthesis